MLEQYAEPKSYTTSEKISEIPVETLLTGEEDERTQSKRGWLQLINRSDDDRKKQTKPNQTTDFSENTNLRCWFGHEFSPDK